MNINDNTLIYGVPQGISYGQNERVDELNERIYERNKPDSMLEPNFDPRPVPTKYALFPIVDRRAETNERIIKMPNYMQQYNFNPGTSAPVSGYVANINCENNLRNQYFALQRGAGQDLYMPNASSDLYNSASNTAFANPSRPREEQPYPRLFEKVQYKNENLPFIVSTPIGQDRFYNHTRTQLRNTIDIVN
jgi:hypothetical protein